MKETAELRVVEERAHLLFGDGEGKRLGSGIRKVFMETADPRYRKVGRLQTELGAKGDSFFFGWHLTRRYSTTELQAARVFHASITAVFEPVGEECGTDYDEAAACALCGSGAPQQNDLRLDFRKIPSGKDIARTIADEVIVSQRLAEFMVDAGLKGVDLRPARHKARYQDDPMDISLVPTGREILRKAEEAGCPRPTPGYYVWINRAEMRPVLDQATAEYVEMKQERANRRGAKLPIWHQLVPSAVVDIVPPTRAGNGPFDDDPLNKGRCPLGHLIGLNLLSEVSLSEADHPDLDVFCSRQYVGCRRGVLRPSQPILLSPKFYRLLESEKIKGVTADVAYWV